MSVLRIGSHVDYAIPTLFLWPAGCSPDADDQLTGGLPGLAGPASLRSAALLRRFALPGMLLPALGSTGISYVAPLIVAALIGRFTAHGAVTAGEAMPYVLGFAGLLLTPATVTDPDEPEPLRHETSGVRFEGVGFTHAGGRSLFTGLDLDVPSGTRIGLVGRSGGGKTTLTRLLLRMMDVQEGRILIGGQDIRRRPARWTPRARAWSSGRCGG